MSLTALTPLQLKQNNYTVQAGDLAVSFAADTVNGNEFTPNGNEILLVQNTDASAHTFTLSSAADELGRTGDITAYSVAATSFAAIQLSHVRGWAQSDGTIHLTSSNSNLKFAVLRHS
jgi:hypothetical protein